MHYHQNHQWCSQSNWTDGQFDARHSVAVEKYIGVYEGLGKDIVEDDWTNLITTRMVIDHRKRGILEKHYAGKKKYDDELLDMISEAEAPCLNQNVIDWLNANVAPSTDVQMWQQPQGWAMGNDEYRSRGMDLMIWFLRRRDAMNFIKMWSTHKKPTTFCNYFKDDRRTLVNGKLIKDIDHLEVEISHKG